MTSNDLHNLNKGQLIALVRELQARSAKAEAVAQEAIAQFNEMHETAQVALAKVKRLQRRPHAIPITLSDN